MSDTAITRFPGGVSTLPVTHPLSDFPAPDPTRHVVFHEDFLELRNAAAGVTGWHLDESDATGDDNVNLALTDAHGGVATFSPGAAAGDNLHYQWAHNTTVLEPFKAEAGKQLWLRSRFKVEDADQMLVILGLHNATDDPWNGEPTDQFLIRTLAAAPQTLQVAVGKTASTEVTIALGDLADDTWTTVTVHYDGKSTVRAWRENDAGDIIARGSVSVTSATAGDLLPDTELTIVFGGEAVDTGTDVVSIDYVTVLSDR